MSNLIRTQSNSSTGNKILIAKGSKKIVDCDEKEISDKLKYLLKVLGITNIPDEMEKKILVDFIRDDWKKYGIDEIVVAFVMALKGEFEAKLDHYNTFSVKYMCDVMREYEKHRQKAIRNAPKELYQKTEPTLLEQYKIVADGVTEHFNNYKELGVINKFSSYQFEWLEKEGIISLGNEKKFEIVKDCKPLFHKEIEAEKGTTVDRNLLRRLVEIQQAPDKEQRFIQFCRVQALKFWFDCVIEMGEDINDYLTIKS